MTSTTYVARTALTVPATESNTRTTSTTYYTHAVIDATNGQAWTWHHSLELAQKAATKPTHVGGLVVEVERHEGGKATVLRRLAAELVERKLVILADQLEDAERPAAPTTPARASRTWDASTATTHVCAGACGQELPATSYPTTGKPGQRGVVCRKDRDAARSAA